MQRAGDVSSSVPATSDERRRQLEAALASFEPKLFAVARRLCGDPVDAKDLVQDTLERALRSQDVPPTEPRVRAWLYTILQNVFLDHCRRERTKAMREGPLDPEVEATCPVPEPDPAPAWATITHGQLRSALDEVKEDFRSVYELHEFKGHSYEEIARQLGIARATVGTRLVRARQRLRVLLAGLLGEKAEVSQ